MVHLPRLLVPCTLAGLLTACTQQLDIIEQSTETGTTDAPGDTSGTTDHDIEYPTTGVDEQTTGEPPVTTATTTTDAATTTDVTTTGEPDATTDDEPVDSTTTTDDTTTADPDTTTGGDGLARELPEPSKPCPPISDGTVVFHPEGVNAPRDVRIWMDPDTVQDLDGPVVFYWHGTGGNPQEAQSGLGELGISEILDAGGIVVAATSDPLAGVFPWYLVLGQQQDDLLVADEVLACAHQQFGVDPTRIHSLGFSAGALHTAQMSIRRSSWIASVVLYSGGLIFGAMPEFEQPDNDFPAMIFHGGAGDQVVVGFKQASEDYQAYLTANDDFSFICDHGGGHSIPDAQDSVMQFFHDHPFGVSPEPYADELPDGFPAYCALP